MSTIKVKNDLSEIIESIRSLIEATYRPANVGRCGQRMRAAHQLSPSNYFDVTKFDSQATEPTGQIAHLTQYSQPRSMLH